MAGLLASGADDKAVMLWSLGRPAPGPGPASASAEKEKELPSCVCTLEHERIIRCLASSSSAAPESVPGAAGAPGSSLLARYSTIIARRALR